MSVERIILINLLLYLIGFGFLLYKRNTLSEQSIGWLSVAINFVGVLFSMGIRLSDISSELISYKWFYVGKTLITFDLFFNDLTFLMYFLVQFVALWVQIFSIKYMEGDESFGRYFALINLFVLSMIGIVVSGNLLQIYIFWELVGTCSYFLIGFWYEKQSATNAAKKAFIVNRIGDVGLFIGIILIYRFFGTFELGQITTQVSEILQNPNISDSKYWVITTIGILIFCGCIAKSAQFPLQIWLPDAMEGPTPVSALIHAATMVAAGIFLMARIYPILTTDALMVMTVVGTITMFLGAFSAIMQSDIKKMLAYSTISQLGVMVVGLGVGAMNAAIFHLLTHAFFKAGLFLSAGAVIHHAHHEQDMRKMGGFRKEIPIVYYSHLICACALVGIPLFSGFMSKDAILIGAFEWASRHEQQYYYTVPVVALLTTGMTAFYMTRQIYLVYFERNDNPLRMIADNAVSAYKSVAKQIENIVKVEDEIQTNDEEGGLFEFLKKLGNFELPLVVMAIASTGFVFSTNPLVAEHGWFAEIFPLAESKYYWVAYVAFLVAFLGILLSYIFVEEEVQKVYFETTEPQNALAKFGFHNFYLDKLYYSLFIHTLTGKYQTAEDGSQIKISNGLMDYVKQLDALIFDRIVNGIADFTLFLANINSWFEQNVIDSFVNFFAWLIARFGFYTRYIQNGKAQSYLIGIFIGVILLIVTLISFG
ncbi:MAG: NADH-quinone oxidoreductase subunit L [Spirosomataceae bacterium]